MPLGKPPRGLGGPSGGFGHGVCIARVNSNRNAVQRTPHLAASCGLVFIRLSLQCACPSMPIFLAAIPNDFLSQRFGLALLELQPTSPKPPKDFWGVDSA
jgi:hypothetical protein